MKERFLFRETDEEINFIIFQRNINSLFLGKYCNYFVLIGVFMKYFNKVFIKVNIKVTNPTFFIGGTSSFFIGTRKWISSY